MEKHTVDFWERAIELLINPNEDCLPRFLATSPTQLHFKKPENSHQQWVFWSQFQNHSTSSSGESSSEVYADVPDHPQDIREKIKSAFINIKLHFSVYQRLIIQFWAVEKCADRKLLTTSGQPFAVNYISCNLDEYRLCSMKYRYNLANNVETEEDPMIISGAPANAFLHRLPEIIVLDSRDHRRCPLVRSALNCELMVCLVLPVYDPSQNCCVGVVECSTKLSSDLLEFFNQMNIALEGVGLSTFYVREQLLFKTIHGLEHARDEAEEALMIACESHNLDLAQVWIGYEGENYLPFSSSSVDTRARRVLGLKLIDQCVYSHYESVDRSLKYYYDACDMLPWKMGKGLALKTLQDHKPRFCIKISKLSDGRPEELAYKNQYSYLAICMRSFHTRDFDYVFEFVWPKRKTYAILLEALLLTLKRCLPSFRFPSGAELGDELHVLAVKNPSSNGSGYFKIFERSQTLPISAALKQGRKSLVENCFVSLETKNKTTPIPLPPEDIRQQFGRTMKEAAKNLNVSLSTLKRKCKELGISEWQGPNFVKRKVNGSYENQSETNEEDNIGILGILTDNAETYSDNVTLTIKAEYAGDVIKFHLPASAATFAVVNEEIGKRFKLNPNVYTLKYFDEDNEWILMISDQDIRDCITSSKKRNRTSIRLRVHTSTRSHVTMP